MFKRFRTNRREAITESVITVYFKKSVYAVHKPGRKTHLKSGQVFFD